MKLTFLICFAGISSLASAGQSTVECSKGTDTLSMTVGAHLGNGPTLYGIRFNQGQHSSGDEVFKQILKDSSKCVDLATYVRLNESEVILCGGEMIALNGAYGQVIMSRGAVAVVKNIILPASGYVCN